jgi:flagellar protein FliS
MGTRLSRAYLLTKVLTATSQEVVVYLYEGAIGYLHRAKQALEANDRAAAGIAIERALGIIIELSGTLNFEQGGALAVRLNNIYNFLIESLTLAGGRGSAETIESCESILTILHDAWQQTAASTTVRKAQQAESALARPALQISA